MATGRAKEAEVAYKEAIAIQKILAERHPEVPEYQAELATAAATWASSILKKAGPRKRKSPSKKPSPFEKF